jgi:polar amino acid transport system substrate-binding protein
MRKALIASLCILTIVLWCTGCTTTDEITDFSGLSNRVIGVQTGTASDQYIKARFPDSEIVYFTNTSDGVIALKKAKIDAFGADNITLEMVVSQHPDLYLFPEYIVAADYGFGVSIDRQDLKKTIDEVLREIRLDGTYENMRERWFSKTGTPAPMPPIDLSGSNGILRLGTCAEQVPFSFVDANRNIVGFDIEIISYVAKKLDKQLQIINMDFAALLASLATNKVDVIAAGIAILEERKKSILFSDSYYYGGLGVIIRKPERIKPAQNTPDKGRVNGKMSDPTDISKRSVGVLAGSIHDGYISQHYPEAALLHYKSIADLSTALRAEKIDVGVFSYETALIMLREDATLGLLGDNLFKIPMGAGFNQANTELCQAFNRFLSQMKSNGTHSEMINRWVYEGILDIPEIENREENGDLIIGITSDKGLPFTVQKNGRLIGLDIELAERFAAYLGKKPVYIDLDFGSLVAAISTGKVDIVVSTLLITEERKQKVLFSDAYYEMGTGLIALKKNLTAYDSVKAPIEEKSFFERLANSFYINIILEDRYLLILNGLRTTLVISVLACLFGTLLGAGVCALRMSKNGILRGIARVYISVIRGTPVLVLLMLIFYVVFASVNIDPVLVAVIAFGMNFGAYVSEMFRTSIESIDKGQKEAGMAGGFTKMQTFRYIIMPQALKNVLPVYKGEFISLVKITSIVGYIAVQDLTKASDIIRSRTFDAFFPLIMVAVLYFMISGILTQILSLVEIQVDPQKKRKRASKRKTQVTA